VIPKIHIPRLSDIPSELAAAVGRVVSRVARALTEGKFLVVDVLHEVDGDGIKPLEIQD
jgi:hypothetical protein